MGVPKVLAATVLLVLALPCSAVSQAGHVQSTVAEAERLRNVGDFAAAARLLEAHHATHPEDTEGTRLLAETLYWMGDRSRARGIYAAAVERDPAALTIRFDFARMLAETGHWREARTVLEPLRHHADWRGESAALLGTLAYWDGDLRHAVRLFREALAATPNHAEARRQLSEIRMASATWVTVGGGYWYDDQPLKRGLATVEAGWFLTPLTPVAVRVDGRRYSVDSLNVTTPMADLEISHYIPPARLQLRAGGGIVHRSPDAGVTDRVGLFEAGLRLPRGVTPSVRIERSSYFHTTASLATPVTFTGLSAGVKWDHRGWMAEAEHRRRRYFDDNQGWTAYAWLLAPIVRGSHATLQAGYAFAVSDTDEVRFSPAGRYDPYHTPLAQRTHSALAAARWAGLRGHSFGVTVSGGLRATETAPFLTGDPLAPVGFGERSFRPATVRGGLVVPLTASLSLTANGEAGQGSYYTWRTASAAVTYRFLPGSDGR